MLLGDDGVPLLLLVIISFSETYSESFLLLRAGELAGDFSSLIFLAVRISMIFSDAFFLTGLLVSQFSSLLSLGLFLVESLRTTDCS